MRPHMIAALIGASLLSGAALGQDRLAEGFRNPPKSARPNVWWHWLNGNVTQDGIAKDLEWMKRSGIGGVQTFDANLMTPVIVSRRLPYMTPEWRAAFRYAAETAAKLDLDLSIAGSPGWSQTGGPWVRPVDGIKKLVWSEASVGGGAPFSVRLAPPPAVSGPFQDLPVKVDPAAMTEGNYFKAPSLYGDVAVLAYRAQPRLPIDMPRQISVGGKNLDVASLSDASLTTGVDIARGSEAAPTTIVIDYARPQTVRSLAFFAEGGAEKFGEPFFKPRLEASDDGRSWRQIAALTLTPVQTTIGFPQTTASHFRIVMTPNATGGVSGFSPAPGVNLKPLLPLLAKPPTIKLTRVALSDEVRVNQFEAKAGFANVLDFASLEASQGPVGAPAPTEVIDLTSKISSDGYLRTALPRGQWRIIRFGWSLTGASNNPAAADATGLEVDKLDAAAVRGYLDHYLGLYKATVGQDLFGRKGVDGLLTDSTEVGAFNWTPRMVEQFTRLRGYDPLPWMPVLTGAVIGSVERSDGFLRDFRQTIADLHASEHYGTVADVAHKNGLKVYGEALEDRRPSLGDDMAMRRFADYPMGALWTYPRDGAPRSTLIGDLKGASSVAHVYGRSAVAAESLTSVLQPWAYAPSDLRRVIDLEFLYGVNRPSIHTSVHQPIDKVPGLPLLVIGQYFTRLETWSGMARAWIDYIARSSYLLQQGHDVADVGYFYGEETPLTALYAEKPLADTPTAFQFDFVNAEIVRDVLTVENGTLVTPGGARYRALYLGGSSRTMTLPMLRRVAQLVNAGATVIGDMPKPAPSVARDGADFAKLAKSLWSGTAMTRFGSGKVLTGTDVDAAVRSIGVSPDFSYSKPAADSDVRYVHRHLDDADIYFVNNRRNRSEKVEARFRITGRVPELWRADTGATEPLSYRIDGSETVVPLEFAPEDSFFVVFRSPTTASSVQVPAASQREVARLDGSWQVAFEADRGAPAAVDLPALSSLSEHKEPGVRYFSGVSTYSKHFDLPRSAAVSEQLMLDLGSVGDVAEVTVNGRLIGTVWHAPWRLDISKAVRRGRNAVQVRVANLWVNRLIGDAQPGATKITTTTLAPYNANAPLRPSGLIGPVRIVAATTAK